VEGSLQLPLPFFFSSPLGLNVHIPPPLPEEKRCPFSVACFPPFPGSKYVFFSFFFPPRPAPLSLPKNKQELFPPILRGSLSCSGSLRSRAVGDFFFLKKESNFPPRHRLRSYSPFLLPFPYYSVLSPCSPCFPHGLNDGSSPFPQSQLLDPPSSPPRTGKAAFPMVLFFPFPQPSNLTVFTSDPSFFFPRTSVLRFFDSV